MTDGENEGGDCDETEISRVRQRISMRRMR